MSRLDAKAQGPADDLTDAMRRSDFGAAAEAVDQLAEAAPTLPDRERAAAKEQLGNLSRQLADAAAKHEQQEAKADAQAKEALTQAGVTPEETERLAKEGMKSDEVQKALQDKGAEPQKAKQVADEARQQSEQKQA